MRIATWNILHGRSPQDGKVDPQRLRDAVVEIDADVLGAQEVDRVQPRSGGRDLAAQLAEALGAKDWRFVPTLVGTPGMKWRPADDADDQDVTPAYGVALFSRYPVTSWHVLRMPARPIRGFVVPAGSRWPVAVQDEPRVALAARLRSPLGELTVATTHLSFVPGQNLWQLRRVARWLRRLPGPQLLLGDLNLPVLPTGLRCGFTPLARTPTHPADRPRRQLDHILARGALAPPTSTASVRLPVSDHCALWAQW